MNKMFVISLGGSLINPGEIDAGYLRKFSELVKAQTRRGDKFIIITGGGRPAREYQEALKKIVKPSPDMLDWLGIYTTRFHAGFLSLIFGKLAMPALITDFEKQAALVKPVMLAGGWKPGRSSDGAAVKLAKLYGAATVINLSNIDYVYTKDPRKFKDAKKIKNISWPDFSKIIGAKWDPGKNVPFDPTAAKFAREHKLKVIIANGKNLKNLRLILKEKPFIGTVIS